MAEEQKTVQLTQNEVLALMREEQAKLEALEREFLQYRFALEETLKAKEALNAIQKAKANESILIPLGAGVLAAATIAEKESVHVTLAGSVLKKDSIPDALAKLENRKKEAEQHMEKLQKQLEETSANVENLSRGIQNAMQQQSAARSAGTAKSA